MTQISTEQALQVPQQLHGRNANDNSSLDQNNRKLLSDDAVTLLNLRSNGSIKKIKMNEYKNELGQDKAFVKETLGSKLAEYKLNPNTKLSVAKDPFGQIELKGTLLQSDLEKITHDLNNHPTFKDAFNRLSQQEPTLNYVDNVVKLSSAYGVTNSLFNSLISEESEYNKLNDIAHRYEALKTNEAHSEESNSGAPFKFEINA